MIMHKTFFVLLFCVFYVSSFSQESTPTLSETIDWLNSKIEEYGYFEEVDIKDYGTRCWTTKKDFFLQKNGHSITQMMMVKCPYLDPVLYAKEVSLYKVSSFEVTSFGEVTFDCFKRDVKYTYGSDRLQSAYTYSFTFRMDFKHEEDLKARFERALTVLVDYNKKNNPKPKEAF